MDTKGKVLIVEDDEETRRAMTMALTARDLEVEEARDPVEGLRRARERTPDVIVLDVMYGPSGSSGGFEFAYDVRKDRGLASVPILMVTSVNIRHPTFRFSPATDAEYLPVDGFIDKPVQPAELVRRVEELRKAKVSVWANWPHKAAP